MIDPEIRQFALASLREMNFEVPLQFVNYR